MNDVTLKIYGVSTMFLALALPSASLLSPPGQNLLTFFFQRTLSISCQSHYPSLGNQSASKLRQPLGTSRPWLVKIQSPESPFINADFSMALVPMGVRVGRGAGGGVNGEEKPAVTEADPSQWWGFLLAPSS